MTQQGRTYRPVSRISLALILLGGVVICAGLFLLLIDMKITDLAVWITLASGVLLTTMGVILDFRGLLMVFSNRQAGMGIIAVIAILLATVILILVNYIASRHTMKFDWTENRLWTISQRVTALLADLDTPVTATVIFDPRPFTGGLDHRNAEYCKRLLEQFDEASEKFTFEFIDLEHAPSSRTLALEKFELKPEDLPCVVFQKGDRKEIVSFDAIYTLEPSRDVSIGFKHGYKGEAQFASAILTLQGRTMPKVYFTTGHGEMSIEGQDLFGIARQLLDNYIEPKTCPDLSQQPVPDDCAALIIVRPETPFRPQELTRIADYLEKRKGSLYLGVDPNVDVGLNDFLSRYGMILDDDIVVDVSAGGKRLVVEGLPVPGHEITRHIQDLGITLAPARSIQILTPPPMPGARMTPTAEPLVVTREQAYGETDIKKLRQTQFVPGQDFKRPGGLVLVAAFEQRQTRSPYDPPAPEEEGPHARIIVVGSAKLMLPQPTESGWALPAGNVKLFFESIKWLAQVDLLIQLEPLDVTERQLDKLEKDPNAPAPLFWILVFALPVALLICGGVVWLFRRA